MPDRPKEFGVWPENWESLETFVRVSTQWRASMGGLIGLDYNALFAILDMYAINDKRQVFEDVQLMERAALAVLNKAAAQ